MDGRIVVETPAISTGRCTSPSTSSRTAWTRYPTTARCWVHCASGFRASIAASLVEEVAGLTVTVDRLPELHPALTLVLRYPMPQAIGTSLVVVVVNTATAFAARLGGSIDWGTTMLFAAAAIAGVGTGTRIADRIDAQARQRGFAALLVAVALYTGGRAATGIW